MKKVFISLLLWFLPTTIVLLLNLLFYSSLVIIAFFIIAALTVINEQVSKLDFRTIQFRRVDTIIGSAIAINSLMFITPPTWMIIIAVALLLIGSIQILREDKMFGISLYGLWTDEVLGIMPSILILGAFLSSILLMISYFGIQFIWLPILVIIALENSVIHHDVFDLHCYNKIVVQILAGIVPISIGLISTIIQYKTIEVLGIQLWKIGIATGFILILVGLYALILLAIKKKEERKQKDEEEKLQEQAMKRKKIEFQEKIKQMKEDLKIKDSNLITLEDIKIGFELEKNLGAQLFIRAQIQSQSLKGLLTISNTKKQVFWDHRLHNLFPVMEYIAKTNKNDGDLSKIIEICNYFEQRISQEKIEKTEYQGEKQFKSRLTEIRERIIKPFN